MKISKGKKVKVEYEGKFEDGEVFDSTKHGEHSHPLEFEAGSGQVIKGFDEGVIGMEEGEEKKIEVDPEEAYGNYNEELKKEIPRENLPKDQEPKEGMFLMIGTPDGKQMPVKIDKVSDDSIVIDLNHPLAGKKLIFNVKVVDVQ